MTSPTIPASGLVDRLFDALADPRRRTVLRHLCERRQPLTVAELVEAILERESSDESEPDDTRVTASLYHVHLPKLRETGLIDRTTDGRIAFEGSLLTCENLFELLSWSDRCGSSSVE